MPAAAAAAPGAKATATVLPAASSATQSSRTFTSLTSLLGASTADPALDGDPALTPTLEAYRARLRDGFAAALSRAERRKEIMRLVLTEGGRFPAIAELYHAQVISRGLPLMRQMLQRAADRGELASDAAARFPHLVIAPLIAGLIWDGLFSAFEPLDVEGLLNAHRELLLGRRAGGLP